VPEPITTSIAALRTHSFRAMASQVTRQLVGVDANEAAAAADRVEHLFGEIESACTRFDPCSPLMIANAAPRSWHHVPDSCLAAIHEAHQANRKPSQLVDCMFGGWRLGGTVGTTAACYCRLVVANPRNCQWRL